MAAAVRSRTPPQGLQTLRVDLDIAGLTIRGTVPNVGLEGVVFGHAGTTRAKHRPETWIYHLLVTWTRQRKQVSWIFGASSPKAARKKTKHAERLGHVIDPLAQLEALVKLYKHGMREPLAFMPTPSETFFLHRETLDKAWTKTRSSWNPSRYSATVAGSDPSIKLVFGHEFPFDDPSSPHQPRGSDLAFDALALRVFDPLYGVHQEVEL